MDEYITKKEALRVISDVFFETDPDGTDQRAVLKCSRAVRALPAVDRMLIDPHKIDWSDCAAPMVPARTALCRSITSASTERKGGTAMTKHKKCYGKCDRCVWKNNGSNWEWRGVVDATD